MVKSVAAELHNPAEPIRLRMADILLIHSKRSLWGWLIRLGTHCYWNHALMVCGVEEPGAGYDRAIVVDPKTAGGLEMGHAAQYLDRPDRFDIAVKRLEADWFQNEGAPEDPLFLRRVCATAEKQARVKGTGQSWKMAHKILRQITIIYRFVRRRIKAPRAEIRLRRIIRPLDVRAFTCGGFIQWCYYQGVFQALDETGQGKSRLKEIIFNPRLKRRITLFDLLTTTPADLARCERLSWKYVQIAGKARPVSSWDDISRILTPSKSLSDVSL
ncbi:MAG: hypothetical protein ABUK03_02265 [Dehalococcoidales bacterium]